MRGSRNRADKVRTNHHDLLELGHFNNVHDLFNFHEIQDLLRAVDLGPVL